MNETEPTNQETASARPFTAAELIRRGESLSVEFKSDLKCLPDRDLISAAVALANTDGGVVLVGVEDDGRVTGLHANHRDFAGVARLVANRTVPQLLVRAWTDSVDGATVGVLEVSKSTSLGRRQRRAMRKEEQWGAMRSNKAQ